MVGVDQQRQLGGPPDAIGLIGELAQRQHDEVGRTEDGQRCHRAGKHAQFETQIRGNARGDGVVHGGWMHAHSPSQNSTKPRAASAPARGHVILPDGGKGLEVFRAALLAPGMHEATSHGSLKNGQTTSSGDGIVVASLIDTMSGDRWTVDRNSQ